MKRKATRNDNVAGLVAPLNEHDHNQGTSEPPVTQIEVIE